MTIRITDLKPDKANRRKHGERNVDMIVQSLREIGAARSIVVDEDGNILAGNATVEAAAKAGIERVQVVDADGQTIIAVRRSNLDAEDKRKLALYDNRTAELAEWDTEQIAADLEAGLDFDGLFSADELAALLEGEPKDIAEAPEPQVDRAEELRELWGTERGQVWEIPSVTVPGKCHKIMCGDSTSAEDVERLMGGEKAQMMWADPPYSRDYASRGEKGTTASVGDWRTIMEKLAVLCRSVNSWYVKLPWYDAAVVIPTLCPSNLIVWAKRGFGLGGGDFRPQHELLLYARTEDAHCNAGADVGDVWDFAVPFRGRMWHVAETPVPLIGQAIGFNSAPGQVVFDPFLGSGTTMCAAEGLGRIAVGMEIAEKYVAVSLQRAADMGLQPRLTDG